MTTTSDRNVLPDGDHIAQVLRGLVAEIQQALPGAGEAPELGAALRALREYLDNALGAALIVVEASAFNPFHGGSPPALSQSQARAWEHERTKGVGPGSGD
jgi:hypothetical protein